MSGFAQLALVESNDIETDRGGDYLFGPFRLEVEERRLWRDGKQVPLTGKAFDTLLLLVERANTLQTQTSLIDRLWPDVSVEPNNLQYNISIVRRALAGAPEVRIETVRGQGYRLLADVQAPARPTHAPKKDAMRKIILHVTDEGVICSVEVR
jgi:DNA-binding winged helix-turn-helix (wHTH) protein